ncbi:MAG: CRISPR-associated helicase Cas3' [Akkermansia sp.]|nr:CRISPR-associated helicase Cas3' [Akkermansia sp.]
MVVYKAITTMRYSPGSVYAHTLKGSSMNSWEPLYSANGHALRTLDYIQSFDNPFHRSVRKQAEILLKVLALYHDMGKASKEFQQYIRGEISSADHKTAAAKWIRVQWPKIVGKLMSLAFYGHHSGLVAGSSFTESESFLTPIASEVLSALPDDMKDLPAEPLFILCGRNAKNREEATFALMLSVRMLHSCLIDADWLATESYVSPENALIRNQVFYKEMSEMSALLESYLGQKEEQTRGLINEIRKNIHQACYKAAEKKSGVYRLNVPTGGGKTLSSLSFALKHAELHDKKRVIYVIPFTSIIEQTAEQFRNVIGADNVLEHHSNISENNDTETNRYAAENWDAPLIITTTIQFFESLFSNKNKKCRKIHNVANSVIILDEVQALPSAYLKPCLYLLKTLQRDFGCTILLCTATQPCVYNHAGFDIGWEEEEIDSLIGATLESHLLPSMKRVSVSTLGKLNQSDLLDHYLDQGETSAMFIVNLTRQAQELFEKLASIQQDGVFHLSARMSPTHRLSVLTTVKDRLAKGLSTVLVATRVVEAGVDISFPVVYRDKCGLDSLAQSAGRCNRHGELPMGRVYYYEAEDADIPPSFVDLRDGIYATADVMGIMPDGDPLSPETVDAYFRIFYNKRKHSSNNWDKKDIICSTSDADTWDFAGIAQAFHLIETEQISILVPFGNEAEQLKEDLLKSDKVGIMPTRKMYRKLSANSVSVYANEWEALRKHCELVHKKAGIWMLSRENLYDGSRGLLRSENVLIDYVF